MGAKQQLTWIVATEGGGVMRSGGSYTVSRDTAYAQLTVEGERQGDVVSARIALRGDSAVVILSDGIDTAQRVLPRESNSPAGGR